MTPRNRSRLIAALAFSGAALAASGSAVVLTRWVEAQSRSEVEAALAAAALPWAGVETDGLQLILTGTAPNEAQRSRAISVASGIVDPARVIDDLATAAAAEIPAPRYALEILRGGQAISLIGLVPESGRAAVTDSLKSEAENLSDMLETAAHPAPEGWDRALRFGLAAVRALPRSKVSISADRVTVTASTDTAAERQELESQLSRQAPAGLAVTLAISAPRPVLTPFSLRFRQDAEGARLEACSAGTEADMARIRAAAGEEAPCTLGLGSPSPAWAEAAEAAIAAVRALGGGEAVLTDADVTLSAAEDADPAAFDRAAAALRARLPAPFVLAVVRPERVVETAAGPAEFDATLEDGKARLRGRFLDDRQRQTALAYAQSRFGAGGVALESETSDALPEGWGLRVLAGLEALSRLHDGQVSVRPEVIAVTGTSGRSGAQGEIARALAERLGAAAPVRIAVRYDKRLDPQAALPTPQECVAALNGILEGHKVTFAPGSASIEAGAGRTLDAVAQAMRPCVDVRMEIGGHTDAQGRDEMNLQLSQARAEAVLEALLARRVPVGNLTARGYGETQPIAGNNDEAGREANRRIEFRLLITAGRTAQPVPAQPVSAPPVPAPQARPANEAPAAAPAAGTEGAAEPEAQDDGAALQMPALEEEPMDDLAEGEEAGPEEAPLPDTDTEAAPGAATGAGPETGALPEAGGAPDAAPGAAAGTAPEAGAGTAGSPAADAAAEAGAGVAGSLAPNTPPNAAPAPPDAGGAAPAAAPGPARLPATPAQHRPAGLGD